MKQLSSRPAPFAQPRQPVEASQGHCGTEQGANMVLGLVSMPVTSSCTLGCMQQSQALSTMQHAALQQRGLSCTGRTSQATLGFRKKMFAILGFCSMSAKEKRREEEGEKAPTLLQSCCFASPSAGQLMLDVQPSRPSHPPPAGHYLRRGRLPSASPSALSACWPSPRGGQ